MNDVLDLRTHLETMALQDAENVGMLKVRAANDTLLEAAKRPNPANLWLELWYENEVCCLFADSNIGKSIYAVQIANKIAESKRVLYFDFELSDKQFQLRYTSDDGKLFRFHDNLYRVEIDPEQYTLDKMENFESRVVDDIENCTKRLDAKVVIIDNLSFLCSATEKGELAGALMMRLITLKKSLGLSILVLAHTPKRNMSNPITQNDLAGSKRLMNFFDSAFTIGMSAKDAGLRYIKQIKVRHGNYTYSGDNVLTCSIMKSDDAFLHFETMGCCHEKEHLKEPSDNDRANNVEKVKELAAQGMSQREIAAEVGIGKSTVNRILGG